MLDLVKKELFSLGLDTVGALPLEKCRVVREYKLKKCGFEDLSGLHVIIFAIPYYTEHKKKNISSYCIPRDYHLYCKELFGTLLPRLKERFSGYKFEGFADDSPIDERDAAARAGLGIVGENGMLITPKYSSYVFLAEIVTSLPFDCDTEREIERCEGCGACKRACPMSEIGECLSALTQKKGELTENEINAIKKYRTAWGCDLCQESCPHTLKAIKDGTIYTNIDFFKTELTPTLTKQSIEDMGDEEFSARAYSWRKKETLLRNLSILENSKKRG